MNKCKAENCDMPVKRNGYCDKHSKQVQRHGRLTPERERRQYPPNSKCDANGCDNKPSKKGYCGKHYRQLRQFGKILERTIHDKNEIIIQENYAEIVLYNCRRQETARSKIDIGDIPAISQYKWGTDKEGYVRGRDNANNKTIALHRLLLQPPDSADIDHINHDTFDNRRCNLRICTRSQNNANAKKRKNNTSGIVGVCWNKQKQKWEVRIWVNKKLIHLGFYKQIEDAAKIRRDAEKEYYGEFAYNGKE